MPEPIWPGSDKGVLLYVGCFLQGQDSYQLPNTEGRLRLASVTSLACDPWMIKFMQRVVRLQGSSLTRYPGKSRTVTTVVKVLPIVPELGSLLPERNFGD